ncbi:phosphotransferase [Tessaracoccus sp. HDW20]|nr:phosphotransferase [Tessaracoccus coleopterorum]
MSAFHSEACLVDDEHERRATARTLAWLDTPHRIGDEAVARIRDILGGLDPVPVRVVPTHGDWQPRNWLADGNWLRVIDFGRFAFRPASTDLCRLATQQWRDTPSWRTPSSTGTAPIRGTGNAGRSSCCARRSAQPPGHSRRAMRRSRPTAGSAWTGPSACSPPSDPSPRAGRTPRSERDTPGITR